MMRFRLTRLARWMLGGFLFTVLVSGMGWQIAQAAGVFTASSSLSLGAVAARFCQLTGGTGCAISATAVASTAEVLQSWAVSDNAGSVSVYNAQSADGSFGAAFQGYSTDGSNGLILRGSTTAAADTGTNALYVFQAGRATSSTGLTAAITTRPLFAFWNYLTNVLLVDASGAWSNPSSNTCGGATAGAVCISDAMTVTGVITAQSASNKGSCTLNGASPSVCTATVAASSSTCTCSLVGATAAIAVKGCAVGLASTTLTITSANAATDVVNYHCF